VSCDNLSTIIFYNIFLWIYTFIAHSHFPYTMPHSTAKSSQSKQKFSVWCNKIQIFIISLFLVLFLDFGFYGFLFYFFHSQIEKKWFKNVLYFYWCLCVNLMVSLIATWFPNDPIQAIAIQDYMAWWQEI
jgi:hypothetical protein